jgi:formamidopyrimidine-DNA glycosylase
MVEGPEASFLAYYISKNFKGRVLKDVIIRRGRYKHHGPPVNFKGFRDGLPLKLLDVYKKGKMILMLFENNWFLIAKMGMVGWFYRPSDKPIYAAEPNIVFEFDNGSLYFSDFRNFGTLTFTQDIYTVYSEINKLAPDILSYETTFKSVYDRVQAAKTYTKDKNETIENALMKQDLIISGVGNIIKSEALYDAGISPKRTMGSLTESEWKRLYLATRYFSQKVLNLLKRDKHHNFEEYFKLHRVYKKDMDPCGNKVKSFRSLDGRITFWVPEIQH